MRIEGDYAVFDSGKRVYTHNGIIGIADDLKVREGYDGRFYDPEYDDDDSLTRAERVELADYMIGLWELFRNTANCE